MSPQPLILALPKGRILDEALPIVRRAGIEPEAALADESSRALSFGTNLPHVKIIRVRSFDVATFVAFGAAHIGIAGNDVLMEFDYSEIYSPLDLEIGKCRLPSGLSKMVVEFLFQNTHEPGSCRRSAFVS